MKSDFFFPITKSHSKQNNTKEVMLGDNALLVSCISAHLLSRHTDIFFWTIFSKMFIQQTALEDRDGVSLHGRGKICLMSRIFKKCLPLGKRTGRFASICL